MTEGLHTDVELSFSCRNLCDTDLLSKSDPMVVVFEFNPSIEDWIEIWRTELIKNNLNPNFTKKLMVQYHFEEQKRMKFAVYDIDDPKDTLKKQDFLGSVDATLGEIVSSCVLQKNLIGGPTGNKGSIIFVAEEAASCNDEITLNFSAKNLDKKDLIGLSDPFLAFYRVHENCTMTVAHRTEVIKNTLNPIWNTMTLPVRLLCNGDLDSLKSCHTFGMTTLANEGNVLSQQMLVIVIQCIDWNRSGREVLIGETKVTINELVRMNSPSKISLELIHPKKAKRKKNYINSGILNINSLTLEKVYSFIDYVQGGTELSCCIAIDFTASNGCPQVPGTLHYCTRDQLSKYAVALHAVGEIISDYDSDNLFPAYGFGARIPPDNIVSHSFPLNGHTENPFCQGIAGVMKAYRYALQTVTLHGPTNFAPIITQVANLAQQTDDGSQYYILLILTDGIICDMPQTKAAVVNASRLPVSIIIVGIGSADFSAMEELDGDVVRLTSRGRRADRDIVQFVPFDDFCSMTSLTETKRQLARAVLAEIPDQLISYMRSKNIKPKSFARGHQNCVEDPHPPPPYLDLTPPYPLI